MQVAQLAHVQDESQVGEARRKAIHFAEAADLPEVDVNKVALAVTEMATNLARHTGGAGGEILLQTTANPGQGGIEILALDRGPGIENVTQALEDGFSTHGTPGAGLGSIQRLATHFDIFSRPGMGTALLAQFTRQPANPRALLVGAVCVPMQHETYNGDHWAIHVTDAEAVLVVCDGLGHGSYASEASSEALRVFNEHGALPLSQLIQSMHGALRKTRGAAISAFSLSFSERKVRFVGLGNVAGAVVTPEKISQMASMAGIVGHELRKVHEFEYGFPENAIALMHSDGLGSKWDIYRYPGLARRHPTLIAGVLYRDFRRPKDDATVVVLREAAR